ncbi:MAG: DEAD/DEAH box helicase family protein [Lachnospiraceae bacterium]|nr:DEAD/DEAH box helicase family protein [Lachnospiraceae bacterium]
MLSIQEIRGNCMGQTYARGKELFDAGEFNNIDIYEDDTYDNMVIDGLVKGSGSKHYSTTVEIDPESEMIVDYQCECPAYETYYGMCKHCVALALVYRERQKNSKNKKGALPAVKLPMQTKTTEALRDMMEKYARQDRGYLFGGFYHEVKLEPRLASSYRGYEIEFKIGAARMYVLKNIPKLIYDVEHGNEVSYGKNLTFVHDRSAFTEEALAWIDVMGEIVKGTTGQADLHAYTYGGEYRCILLRSYGMEQILNMCMDREITLDGVKRRVVDENPRLTLTVTPQADKGAFLSMRESSYIKGNRHYFAVAEDKIYRCSEDFYRQVWPLIETLKADAEVRYGKNEALYLNRSDYQAFCGNVLPKITPYIELDNKGVSFEEYMPREAEFSVYLSLAEEDNETILAKCEACYGTESFNLLEDMNLGSDYRDAEAESNMRQVMNRYFTVEIWGKSVWYCCREDEEVYRLINEGMEELKNHAQLFVDEKLRGVRILTNPAMNIGVSLSGELLELDVEVPDMDLNEVYDILSAYRRRKKYYRMKNGDFVRIEDNGMAILSELSQGLNLSREELSEGRLSIPKYRTSYIDSVLKNHSGEVEIKRSTSFRQLIRNMREYADSDYEVPEKLNAKLRGYQKDGYRWLCTLAGWGFGGILADDMGLGKTVQMLAFLLREKKHALIVCPASLVYNWASEANRFAPDLSVAVIAGSGESRKNELAEGASANLVITSYDLLKRDIEEYKEHTFDYMIIDEAQYIKNAGTQAAKAVKAVRAGVHFALTGTPIENRLGDLWSIFDYVMPGYLYEYPRFKEEIELPVVQSSDEIALERLHRMIQPFILRRRKQDVLKDLPDKLEEVVYTQMKPEQKRLYDAHVKRLQVELAGQSEEEFKRESIKYLAELTKLRQLCCAPELMYENYIEGSGKLDTCMEILANAIEGEHKILLFSQFTQMLELIGKQLEQRKISYLYLSGKNNKSQRQQMVEQFQSGDIPVFLISLKAGGTGLNLTAADMVIHYDPWWNVAAQNQATDRTHRIGQKQVVNVMKLVAKDTIEEKIIKLQEKKAKLSEDVIEGRGVADAALSREELIEMLEER